ncbi:SDR family oxidoreductase [Micromonospora sp. AMSO31t]|uniref:SDR family oxidoreductase n=1 Tax=Micromonospora sp. AMSO31t TaxID=2650566 RepID=UPI001CEDD351|nr:NAD(P)H-binding protein [Micromonospora sp. AMSO31t]
MKLTVIGGTGLIGSQVVRKLTAAGHEAVPAALSTGVDLLTGEGLDKALEGAEVVVNVANSPTFDEASLDFFRTSMTNLLAAGERAGARHQVVLSIVGVDQVPQLDYYRAKTLQEDLLRQGPTPYSIVRATQFFEFVNAVLSWTSDDTTVRLPATPIQPMAAADVVDAVVDVATGAPSTASATSPARTSSPSTTSGGSPWPHRGTTGTSSSTTQPACSRWSTATC